MNAAWLETERLSLLAKVQCEANAGWRTVSAPPTAAVDVDAVALDLLIQEIQHVRLHALRLERRAA